MTDLIGQTIANRRLESLIGSGDLGQVFRARHLGLDREEAVKVVHPSVASAPGFAQRFAQETGEIAQLDHTHIIEIFGAGEEDGHCYLAMELMDPGSLGPVLERRARDPQSLPLGTGLDLIRQAADGLASAHARGHVHHNITPDNLLIARQMSADGAPAGFVLKISDFGLKPANDVMVTPNTDVSTAPASVPIYWSPEQFLEQELDGRSDIYSLGMVLYELATGLLPFSIKNFNEAGITHLRTPPRPPHEVRPELPADLEAIILRCLAKQPNERFASAADLSAALEGVIQTLKPVAASVPKASLTPPLIDPLPDPSTLPRVQVVDNQGKRVLPAQELTGDGITVGRRDCDIVLDDPAVADQHALIDWDGIQIHLIDQGSASGTFLEKTRLQPHVPQPWKDGQPVRIGPFWLRLEPPSAALPSPQPNSVRPQDPPPQIPIAPQIPVAPVRVPTQMNSVRFQSSPGISQISQISRPNQAAVLGTHITVLLEERTLTLTPGQHAVCIVTIINKGNQVHHLRITVEGVPDIWVRGPEKAPQLNPSGQTVVTLNVLVPRTPESKARDYPVMVKVQSEDTPDEVGVAPAVWTVLPFAESSMSVPKKRRQSWRRGRYAVAIRNEGNASDRYTISGADDEELLAYDAEPDQVTLKGGESTRATVTAKAPMYWFGRPQRHDLRIQVKPEAEREPKVERVQFTQRAAIPVWAIPVGIISLLLLAALVYWWTKPAIRQFAIDQDTAVVGDQSSGRVLTENGNTTLQLNQTPVGLRMLASNTYTHTGSFRFVPDKPGPLTLRLQVTNRFRLSVEATQIIDVVTPTFIPTATPVPPEPTLTPLPPTAAPPPPTETTPPTPTLSSTTTPTASRTATTTTTATPDNVLSCESGSSPVASGIDKDARGQRVPLLVYLVITDSDGHSTERAITGGTTDTNGYFSIPLSIQNQRAGYYGVIVRERYTGKEVRSFSCPIPATPSRTPLISPTPATTPTK